MSNARRQVCVFSIMTILAGGSAAWGQAVQREACEMLHADDVERCVVWITRELDRCVSPDDALACAAGAVDVHGVQDCLGCETQEHQERERQRLTGQATLTRVCERVVAPDSVDQCAEEVAGEIFGCASLDDVADRLACLEEAEDVTQAEQCMSIECVRLYQQEEDLRMARERLTNEAIISGHRLATGSENYYTSDRRDEAGGALAHRFPDSTALTPAVVPCGEPHEPSDGEWSGGTWAALHFRIDDPHYYAYQYDSAGIGPDATFTATAFGDLDCDGFFSTFVRSGHIENGEVMRSNRGTEVRDRLE